MRWRLGLRALADVGDGNADLLANMLIKPGQDEKRSGYASSA